jgi:hypothetical protein
MHSSAPELPDNASLCRYLRDRGRTDVPAIARPEDFARPYDSLGTHPDLVARLWDELTVDLPEDCRFVLFGNPVLMHPRSEIVFAFAGGTHTCALRLPAPIREDALAAGAKQVMTYPHRPPFRLEIIGPEWVFCAWLKGEEHWCRSAYESAAASN